MRIVQPEERVERAQRPGEAQPARQEPRADPVPHEEVREAHQQRIARQEDELHEPVAVALGEVPVAGDVYVVPAVEALPEVEEAAQRAPAPGGEVDRAAYEEDAEAVQEAREGELRPYPGRLRRLAAARPGAVLPAPESHPAGHKAQADEREQRDAQHRREIGPEAVVRIKKPCYVEREEPREPERAYYKPRQGVFPQKRAHNPPPESSCPHYSTLCLHLSTANIRPMRAPPP